MSKGYVFLSNSTKPTKEEQNSRTKVTLTNVSKPCLEIALDMGYNVILGINRANPDQLDCELPIHLYDSHSYRSIFAFKDNLIAYKNLKSIVNKWNVKIIHCNTPIGGMVGRLVGARCHVDKIIYTAHGFHFYNGAPLFNRTILKVAEEIMAHMTDAIITMNEEDYQAALKFKLKKGGKVYKVHGVGINLEEYRSRNIDLNSKRRELGITQSDFVCVSAGDLVARKNYSVAIKSIAASGINNIHYLICGEGPEKEELKKIAQKEGVGDRIHFLGFRNDVKELMYISDLFLFTTYQEGMPRSMMEAMACGLPCLASDIRGNRDLIKHGVNGFLCSPTDVDGFANYIHDLYCDKKLRVNMSKQNLIDIMDYSVEKVKNEIEEIYKEVLC